MRNIVKPEITTGDVVRVTPLVNQRTGVTDPPENGIVTGRDDYRLFVRHDDGREFETLARICDKL